MEKLKTVEIKLEDTMGNGIQGNGLAGNGIQGNGIDADYMETLEINELIK